MTTYAINTHAGDGATVAFAVSFEFIRRQDVTVSRIVNATKVETTLTVITTGTPTGDEFVWDNDDQITVGTAPPTGTTLKIQRDTPENAQIVDWQDGSYIIAEDLNTSDEQWLYNIQELYDGLTALDGAITGEAVKSISGSQPVVVDSTNAQTPIISVDEAVSTDDPNSLTSDTTLMSEKAIDDHFKQHVGTTPTTGTKIGQIRIDNTATPQATFWWNGSAWVALTTQGPKGDKGDAGPPPGLQTPSSTVTNIPLKGDGNPGDATVVVSQDAKKDLQFQFGIPVGKTGATGPQGPKGDQGDGVTYKGAIDATTDPEPVSPNNGDVYVNTATGSTTWKGQTSVTDGSRLVWNKATNQWDQFTPTYATDLGYTPAADKGTVTNTNGIDATLPVVDSTNAGLMTPAMLTDLNADPSLDDVLQVGNTSETSVVVGAGGNNSTIGQGTIEVTGSVEVEAANGEVQISSDPYIGVHGDAGFINVTNKDQSTLFFLAGSNGTRVGNSFNVGGADLSSTTADGFFTQEDGETFIQTQDASADVFRVMRSVGGTNTAQFSIDGEGNTNASGNVTASGNITLSLAGAHVRWAGTNDAGQPRLIDIQAPTNDAGFTGNYTLTLPNSLGSAGDALITDASGNLSWGNAAGLWSRTGSTLSPSTADDNVDIGTGQFIGGSLSVGGPLRVTANNSRLLLAGQNDAGEDREIGLRAPAAASGMTNWNLTLPATAGTNGYVLQTNGSGNCSWVANGGGPAPSITRVGTTQSSTTYYRVMLGTGNNNAGTAQCFVVTDRSSLYYRPQNNTLTCGSYAGASNGIMSFGTLQLRATTWYGVYETTKRSNQTFGIKTTQDNDVTLQNSKGNLRLSDGGSIYLKTNSKSQNLYIRTGTTKPGTTITGYASMYCSKSVSTRSITWETEFEIEGDDDSKYEMQTLDHGDGQAEESREYIGRREKAITIIRELRNRCQSLEARNKAVDEQLETVMARLAELEKSAN